MPNALDSGVSISDFWDSTLLELRDIIESRKRMERANISRAFVLAEAISTRISYFFSDPETRDADMILKPWHVYPELFIDEEKEAEMRKEQHEQKIQTQKVIAWAEHINAMRHRKEEAE